MNIFDLAAKITLDSKGYEKGLDAAKSAIKGAGTVISGSVDRIQAAGTVALKTYTALASAAATGVGALIKSATDGYANFEQLVGGVETLFGAGGKSLEEYAAAEGKTVAAVAAEYDSLMRAQQNMLDNAAGAYKTAGLSANDYIETVTSFSAALIKSLEGDTEAAAQLADQAIVDMSDNANKMGSDMSLIQNAYQGFAKGNYTMLDNLKLGYGGTKTEMERLIKDAAELDDSVDASSMSFDNIVRAIHAVQTEMGITGTTAKEAATTIQGSAASMKAAWGNWLTGLADDTQDIGKLTDQLIDSVGTYADNLLPRIEIAFDSMVQIIDGRMDQIGGIAADVLLGITSKGPAVISAATNILKGVSGELMKRKDDIKTAATTLFSSFLSSFDETLDAALPLIEEFVPVVADGFISGESTLFNAGVDLIMAVANGLSKNGNAEKLAKSAAKALTGMVSKVTKNLDPFLDAGLTIILAVGEGLIDNSDELIDGAFQIVDSLVTFVTDHSGELVGVAVTLISKLATGISDNLENLVPAAVDMIVTLALDLTKPENIVTLFNAAAVLIKGLATGLWNALPTLISSIPDLVFNITSVLFGEWRSFDTEAEALGEQTGQSFMNGIAKAFENLFENLWGQLLDSAKEQLQIITDGISMMQKDDPFSVLKGIAYIVENLPSFQVVTRELTGGGPMNPFLILRPQGGSYNPPTDTTKADGNDYTSGGIVSSTTNSKELNVQMNIEITEAEDPRALAEEISREMQSILEEEEDANG